VDLEFSEAQRARKLPLVELVLVLERDFLRHDHAPPALRLATSGKEQNLLSCEPAAGSNSAPSYRDSQQFARHTRTSARRRPRITAKTGRDLRASVLKSAGACELVSVRARERVRKRRWWESFPECGQWLSRLR
jgi:hypothetical protein